MKKHQRYLTNRDRNLLQFVDRYRVGSEELFRPLFFQQDSTPANMARVLRRLVRRGLLRKIGSGSGLAYYALTRRGQGVLNLPIQTPRPLTEQSLPIVLAVATYCVRNSLKRLTNGEFRELYPELWRPGLRSSNYVLVDTKDGLKLEMLLVDRGGAARRIRSRVRRVIAQRYKLPDFLSLMESGRFRINVLTGSPEQQDNIRRKINRESFGPVEVTTSLVAELAEILLLRR